MIYINATHAHHILIVIISLAFAFSISALINPTVISVFFGFIITYSVFRITLRYLNGDWKV